MELLPIKKNIHTYSPLYGWVKEEREWGNGGMEIIMSHCHFNSRKGGNRGLIYSIYESKRQAVSLCLGRV